MGGNNQTKEAEHTMPLVQLEQILNTLFDQNRAVILLRDKRALRHVMVCTWLGNNITDYNRVKAIKDYPVRCSVASKIIMAAHEEIMGISKEEDNKEDSGNNDQNVTGGVVNCDGGDDDVSTGVDAGSDGHDTGVMNGRVYIGNGVGNDVGDGSGFRKGVGNNVSDGVFFHNRRGNHVGDDVGNHVGICNDRGSDVGNDVVGNGVGICDDGGNDVGNDVGNDDVGNGVGI
eukprot:TRINITY_DN5166_c0_g2_i10.p1 TRINITY_DN5166_c0_g2~~TRINITY_DN5166_c0_g2_i10.p1  ORF type:complete len:230 (-),score=59.69 TRINITY_DN5166_c0_g2_i10:919-1608(-)